MEYGPKVVKWCELLNAYTDKVNYYTKQLMTATEDQIQHFTTKKEYYLAKRKAAAEKYDYYSDLFVGDGYVKYLPADMQWGGVEKRVQNKTQHK